MPDISVIVPTHNRAPLLAKHLGALEVQTFPRQATEWIVVCDGCTDRSAQVARDGGADVVIETSGFPASSAIVLDVVRKEGKAHGLQRRIEGADPRFEIGAITEVAAGQPNGPALLFDSIKNFPRGFRIFANATTPPPRSALAAR